MKSPIEMAQSLSAPFSSSDIEWRVQQSGVKNNRPWAMVLAYVTNRAIQHRLDEVCGPMGWRNEYREEAGGVMCGISIWCGDRKEWVTKWDGAEKTDVESFKGGLSASMKRAAVQWGIGRYLYKLESGFAQCFTGREGKNRGQAIDKKTRNKTYFTWNAPALPAWALPESEQQPQQHQPHQIHPPQQQIPDQQPVQQQPQIISESVKSTMTLENGEYIVRDNAFGKLCKQNREQEKGNRRQSVPAKQPLNEAQKAAPDRIQQHIDSAQQTANELVARRNEASRAKTAKINESRQQASQAAEQEQQKINDMAGYPVITPNQIQQLRNVIKQADWSERGFCNKAQVNQLGYLPAERFEGAITWLQGIAKVEQERRLRSR